MDKLNIKNLGSIIEILLEKRSSYLFNNENRRVLDEFIESFKNCINLSKKEGIDITFQLLFGQSLTKILSTYKPINNETQLIVSNAETLLATISELRDSYWRVKQELNKIKIELKNNKLLLL